MIFRLHSGWFAMVTETSGEWPLGLIVMNVGLWLLSLLVVLAVLNALVWGTRALLAGFLEGLGRPEKARQLRRRPPRPTAE